MGQANVCVFNDFEGLYYIDYKFLNRYSGRCDGDDTLLCVTEEEHEEDAECAHFAYDEYATDEAVEEAIDQFAEEFCARYKSFRKCDKSVDKCFSSWDHEYVHAILESSLFYIAVEDNNGLSIAFELLQKSQWDKSIPEYGMMSIECFQKRHFKTFLNGMKKILFNQFPEIEVYNGAWSCKTIKKEDEEDV